MAEPATEITSVKLARDRLRLFVTPAAFLLLAASAGMEGVLAGGPARIFLFGLAALAAISAIYLGLLVSSYRLFVEPGGLTLRWRGGERHYRLVRGSISRVTVEGRGARALQPRFGALGWAVGPAVLGGEEPIELIRLSIRPAMILVPTEGVRLAIAAAVESDLLAALRHAVAMQMELDEAVARAARAAEAAAAAAAVEAAPEAVQPGSVPHRVLTGIERSLIEQRLAAQRAAIAAAQAARAEAAAGAATDVAASSAAATAAAERAREARRIARSREPARWVRPSWLTVPGPASVAASLPIVLPLVGAAIAWTAVAISGRPALTGDDMRALLVGLALVGPLGAFGAFVARNWFPRLGGLVSLSSLAGLTLLARTILA